MVDSKMVSLFTRGCDITRMEQVSYNIHKQNVLRQKPDLYSRYQNSKLIQYPRSIIKGM